MWRHYLILSALLSLFPLICFPQDKNPDNQLRGIIRQYGQVEVTIPYPGLKSADRLSRNVSILSVKDNIIFISLSPLTVEWFINQGFIYSIPEHRVVRGIESATSSIQAMNWDKYPTYPQYDSIMQAFNMNYPALCRLDTIGTTIDGRLVLAIRLTGAIGNEADKPNVFYTSTIHGDETGGFVMMLHLADYLLNNYGNNERVTSLMDNLNIWINPLANPDGTYTSGKSITSPVRYNAEGEDLNRNFPDPETPHTIQQKETADMVRFLKKHRFVLSANFHSGDEVVNYPWDRWPRLHADNDWFYSVSRKYADTVHTGSKQGYMTFMDNGVTNGYEWYLLYGGRQDYVTYSLQGREVTIELDNKYITPSSQLQSLWQENWRSMVGYLENALFGIRGKVVSAVTSVPLKAQVFIAGHDKDSSQVFSDSLTGNFTRMVSPGIWNLSFSSPGFRDTVMSNVEVVSQQKIHLDVKMKPISYDTTKNGTPLLYPNPALTRFNALLPANLAGEITISIINYYGELISEEHNTYTPGFPVLIFTDKFPPGTYTVVFKNLIKGSSCNGRIVVIK